MPIVTVSHTSINVSAPTAMICFLSRDIAHLRMGPRLPAQVRTGIPILVSHNWIKLPRGGGVILKGGGQGEGRREGVEKNKGGIEREGRERESMEDEQGCKDV